MKIDHNLERVASRHEELGAMLSRPGVSAEDYGKFSKEYAEVRRAMAEREDLNSSMLRFCLFGS